MPAHYIISHGELGGIKKAERSRGKILDGGAEYRVPSPQCTSGVRGGGTNPFEQL